MIYGGYGMGGGGLFWILAMGVLLIIPFWKILPRNGIPNWVAIFAIIPVVALVLLWVVAFRDQLDGRGGTS